ALRDVLAHLGRAFLDVHAVRVTVHEYAFARSAAEQLVDRHARHLAEDVPQRDVDRGDGGHGDGTAAPVRAPVEELEDVLDPTGIAADEIRYQVILEVGRDREFAAIERGVTEAGNTGPRNNFQRDEVARGAGHDHF